MVKSFERYFSEVAKATKFNPIRDIMKHVDGRNDIISLSGGKPSEEYFPLGSEMHYKYKPIVGNEINVTIKFDQGLDLNYNGLTFSKGLPSLVELCKKLMITDRYESLPAEFYTHYDTCLSSSSTDAISKSIILLTNPEDVVFSAEFAYTGIKAAVGPLQRKLVGVPSDEDGIIPQKLASAIEGVLDEGLQPKMLYIVPNGQNPTSTTISTKRRKQLYKICDMYNIVILVDDPYCMLELDKEPVKALSFLELDKSRRVVRLDSFSKIMAPGFRIGAVTAPKEYIAKFSQYAQVTSWGISGISQKVLEGLLKTIELKPYLKELSRVYRERRDFLVSCLQKYIPSETATFTVPTHGLFLWLVVNKVEDTSAIVDTLFKEKVSLMPGGLFSVSGKKSNAFRIAFCYATNEQIEAGIQKLKNALELV